MKESQMQMLFGKFIKSTKRNHSAVFELKICKGSSLPFNAVKNHQILALQQANSTGLYHKLTDQPWITDRPNPFTLQKPFDCFFLMNVKAYVVIWFYKPRKTKKFIFITIEDYIYESINSTRKSLTEDRAKEIGFEVVIK